MTMDLIRIAMTFLTLGGFLLADRFIAALFDANRAVNESRVTYVLTPYQGGEDR